jgi:hypothetical protein
MPPRSRRPDRPELCCNWRPHQVRGRREGRVPTGTRGPRAKESARGRNHRLSRKQPGLPCAMGLRLLRALPGDRLACPRHRHRRRPRHQRRGVGTTRLDRPRRDVRPHPQGCCVAPRPPLPAATSRDDRDAPLSVRAGWPDKITDLGPLSIKFLVFGIHDLHCLLRRHAAYSAALAPYRLDDEARLAPGQVDEKGAASP